MDCRPARAVVGLVPCTLLVFSLWPVAAKAQNVSGQSSPRQGSIQGKVTFANRGESSPLPGVTMRLNAATPGVAPASAKTDADGHYLFADLPPDTYTLQLSLESFQTQSATITLAKGESATRDFSMAIASLNETIAVQAEASPVAAETETAAANTVSSQQILELPIATETLQAALPDLPTVMRTMGGLLSIRGLMENQGMLLVDSVENVDIVTGSFSIPISVDAIQNMTVSEAAYPAEYGGFTGGLTEIHTKTPADNWNWGINNFIPGFRGKNGHLRGVQDEEPRVYLTGPIRKKKLDFAEAATYQLMNVPVRGLSWPFNETRTRAASSLTNLQETFSQRHLLSVNLNVFWQRVNFANINAQVPQSASSNDGQRGISFGATDTYQFASGMVFGTTLQYTRLDTNGGGQGPADMLITPEGWGGNFFNSWTRHSRQLQVLPTVALAPKSWHGRHEIKAGVALTGRSYSGAAQSHPVRLLREDRSTAEQIDFFGTGATSGTDTEISEFLQDHWALNDHLNLDLGVRLLSQTAGSSAALGPRVGISYAPGKNRKTAIRAGAGIFHDRVPLLETGFPLNLTRVVSLFDGSGQLLGPPVSFQNVLLNRAPGGGFVPGGDALDVVARSFTWNAELDRELRRNLQFRLNYLQSATRDLPVVLPTVGAAGSPSFLGLAAAGSARYHAFEATVHYQPTDRDDLTVSYIHSSTRSDLNLLENIYVPFEQPVIRPNVYGISPSDVPDRVVATGTFALPWRLFIVPVVDTHTGLPYSTVDVLQNYAGAPNSSRFSTYFSVDFQVYKEFDMGSLPLLGWMKGRMARLGIFSLDATNRANPLTVYNNVTSPLFGQFAGFTRRIDGFVFELH